MSSSSRPAASVPELDAPPSVGSSMPPELAVDMARAGELLDLGDTIGAWRIVRRVLDRAAPELLVRAVARPRRRPPTASWPTWPPTSGSARRT